jgi:hypothetical protein
MKLIHKLTKILYSKLFIELQALTAIALLILRLVGVDFPWFYVLLPLIPAPLILIPAIFIVAFVNSLIEVILYLVRN